MQALMAGQSVVFWLLALLALGLQGFAFSDALTQRKSAFPATGNQTKAVWVGGLAVALAIGIVSLPNFSGPLNLFNLLAVVAAGVYLTRVRPGIRSLGSGGPYGGW
jgi:hypothetical protein